MVFGIELFPALFCRCGPHMSCLVFRFLSTLFFSFLFSCSPEFHFLISPSVFKSVFSLTPCRLVCVCVFTVAWCLTYFLLSIRIYPKWMYLTNDIVLFEFYHVVWNSMLPDCLLPAQWGGWLSDHYLYYMCYEGVAHIPYQCLNLSMVVDLEEKEEGWNVDWKVFSCHGSWSFIGLLSHTLHVRQDLFATSVSTCCFYRCINFPVLMFFYFIFWLFSLSLFAHKNKWRRNHLISMSY